MARVEGAWFCEVRSHLYAQWMGHDGTPVSKIKIWVKVKLNSDSML